MKRRALQFPDSSRYQQALRVMDDMASNGPFEYQPIGDKVTLLPEWCFRNVEAELRSKQICYHEIQVVPLSDLPPDKQAEMRRRGWSR